MENVDTQRTRPGAGPLEGTVLAGRYRLAQVLSSGANTVIMDAIDVQTDRPVTVKVVRPEHAESAEFRRKFRRLAEISNAVTHPNIASVTDWGEIELRGASTVFWTVDALGGGSLRDLLDRGRLLEPGQALVLGLEACRALDAAHHKGLYHTEITPSKMVFGVDRRLRVVDFGMARLLAEPAWAESAAVPTHVARYASPEQALGLPIDAKTDVYALALVMIEAVTGSVPFAADSTVATLAGRVDKLMPVSADLGALASVLERAGRPESSDRFTAAEFGRALVQAAPRLPKPDPIPILASGTFDTHAMRRPTDPTGGVERPAPVPGLAGVDENGVRDGAAPTESAPRSADDDAEDAPAVEDSDTSDDTDLADTADTTDTADEVGAAEVDNADEVVAAEEIDTTAEDVDAAEDGDDSGAAVGLAAAGGAVAVGALAAEVSAAELGPSTGDPSDSDDADDAANDGDADEVPEPDEVPDPDDAPTVEVATIATEDTPVEETPTDDAPADADTDEAVTDEAVTDEAVSDDIDSDDTDSDEGPATEPIVVAGTDERDESEGPDEPTEPAESAELAALHADLDAQAASSPTIDSSAADTVSTDTVSTDTVSTDTASTEAASTDTAVLPTAGATDGAADGGGGSELFDDDPSRRRKGPIIALVLILLVGLGALGYAVSVLLQTKTFTVPALAGVSEDGALDQISGNDWDIEVLRERSDSFPEPDTVIRTIPAAGVELDEGEPFTLVLSDGPEFRTLPELDELPFNTAAVELAELGLIGIEADAREFSETVPSEAVISWSVEGDVAGEMEAGAQILPGETIVMVLSQGPEPRTIPDLTTGTGPEGRETIEAMQLEYVRDPDVFSDTVPVGQVVSQTPAAGEQLERGGTVTVQVSKGPDVVEFPNLEGLEYAAARDLLIETGYTIGSLLGTTQGTFVEATIDGTDAVVGEALPRGTAVDLIFL